MSSTYQNSERKPVMARLEPDVHAAAVAIARSEHMSLGALVARAVERDLLSRLDGLRREAGR